MKLNILSSECYTKSVAHNEIIVWNKDLVQIHFLKTLSHKEMNYLMELNPRYILLEGFASNF